MVEYDCTYQWFIGCPCCSPEWETVQETYKNKEEHDKECGYTDGWDEEHEHGYEDEDD